MAVAVPIELRRKMEIPVTVVNEADHLMKDMYDGVEYRFPPRTKRTLAAHIAWLWFGNPDLKEDHTDWSREVSRVRERVGATQFQPKMDGQFYVREWKTGPEFYAHANIDQPRDIIDAEPIDDEDGIEEASLVEQAQKLTRSKRTK